MFSGSSRKRDNDERSSVSSSSRHGHDKKKREVSRSSTPYSASHAPPPPSGPPPEASSEERILTPDEDELSDDTRSVLFDEPPPNKPKNQEKQPARSSPTMPAQSTSSSGKGNAPDVFRGPGDDLDTFLTQCLLYFFLNQEKFEDESKRVTFMISYMRGVAYATFEERLGKYLLGTADSATKKLFSSTDKFVAELNLCFGGSDKKRAAERELHKLKQSTAAKDYAANFQRLTAGLGWNDESLMSQFYAGLKPEVRIAVLRKESPPTNLNDLIRMAIKEDDLIHQMYLERKGQAPRRNFNKSNQGKSRNSPDYYGPKPMELDALQRKPKQQKGRKASTQKGKCYNCGKEGHFANKCRQPKREQGKDTQRSHLRKLEVVDTPVAHLAMMSVINKDGKTWKFGPNQNGTRNLPAIHRAMEIPRIKENASHPMHHLIPMSECDNTRCKTIKWEHSAIEDPGQPDWNFGGRERRISNTQLRKVLEIEDVCDDVCHFHHRHIPMNLCRGTTCVQHYRKDGACYHRTADAFFWQKKPAEEVNPLAWAKTYDKIPADGNLHEMDDTSRKDATRDVINRLWPDDDTPKPLTMRQARVSPNVQTKPPNRIQWQPKPVMDGQGRHHRDLTNEECDKDTCAWHGRVPTPAPTLSILQNVRRNFTPDTGSEDEADSEDDYIRALQTAITDLMFEVNTNFNCKLDMQIPHDRFDIFFKLRCNPEKDEPKEQLSLCIKAFAKEQESESETDEEDGDSSDVEIIHEAQSENGDDLWT